MRSFINKSIADGVSLVVIGLLAVGCSNGNGKRTSDADSTPIVHEEQVSKGPVSVTLTATPGRVFLNREVLVSLRATTPPTVKVVFPPIGDRLQGFLEEGHFDREPIETATQTTIERVIRLTPLIADEYRIAPMAITFTDSGSDPIKEDWLATPPIVLPVNAVTEKSVGNDIAAQFEHRWVYPPLRTVSGYLLILILILVLGFVAWKLIRRARRRIRLMLMSPRERALEELKDLLALRLIEKNLVKDFYVELTMVVRRYIERQHRIRAPEQTTEEFLSAVSDNPNFGPEVVKRLRLFLEAADLVKFAAYRPDKDNVDSAIGTARDYITSDADRTESARGVATVTEHKEQLL
jgi:hypothetical protein